MDNELYHYGVKGMKWGVRRASKRFSSSKSTSEQREKAFRSLQKHYRKGTAKVAKLERQRSRMEAKRDNRRIKNDPKTERYLRRAAEYESKASRYEKKGSKYLGKAAAKRKKVYGFFTSASKATALEGQARELETKGNFYMSKANILNSTVKGLKAKAEENRNTSQQIDKDIESIITQTKLFRTELSNIDKTVIEAGRKYVKRLHEINAN